MDRTSTKFAYASLASDTLFHGKWRIEILCALCSGPVRLGQLTRMIPRSSKKVLTQNLRDLEAAGIVVRRNLSDLVLHVEYELNEELKDGVVVLIEHISQWGEAHMKERRSHTKDTSRRHLLPQTTATS